MNKIIVVGHPQSGLDKVHELLLDCGMAQALPSRREGFTPEQIGATLLKAHGAVPVQQLCSADELQQIAVAPVWQGLALDLVLANMEQPLWGWADVQAVYLLDYWKAQDPQTMFVLVYDTPQTALTRHAVEHLETNPEALQAKVNAWVAYNSALLSFHLRNPERSLLVHADQVQASATHYVQQLSARMDAPLQLPDAAQVRLNTSVTDDGAHGGIQPVLQAETAEVDIVHDAMHAAVPQSDLQSNALAQWLAQQLLQNHPDAQELYAQLQAAASMPQRAQQQGTALLAGHDLQQQHYQAWAAFVAQQTAMQESVGRLAYLHKVQAQLKAAQDKATKLQQTEAQLKKELQQATAKPASAELQEENELLLLQLHQVQEELERYYLENQRLKAGVTKPQAKSGQQASTANHYGAVDRIKRQLSYRLGAVMIEKSRTLGGWLSMPFALQAEAKRFHQEKAARKGEKLPPIAHYRDAHEAERVKQHLSYRLGSTLVQRSGSLGGWLSMPCALRAQVKEFQKSRR